MTLFEDIGRNSLSLKMCRTIKSVDGQNVGSNALHELSGDGSIFIGYGVFTLGQIGMQ